MTSFIKFSVLAALFCQSCTHSDQNGGKAELPSNEKKITIQVEDNKKDSLSKSTSIMDDEFVYSILDTYLNYYHLDTMITIREKIAVANLHVVSVWDTLVTFKRDADYFEFHKSMNNVILLNADIASEGFIIGDNLKIGSPYSSFKNRYDLRINADTLIIHDLEKTSYFFLSFDDFHLKRIKFKSSYWD